MVVSDIRLRGKLVVIAGNLGDGRNEALHGCQAGGPGGPARPAERLIYAAAKLSATAIGMPPTPTATWTAGLNNAAGNRHCDGRQQNPGYQSAHLTLPLLRDAPLIA
jgi:hypothetical protein